MPPVSASSLQRRRPGYPRARWLQRKVNFLLPGSVGVIRLCLVMRMRGVRPDASQPRASTQAESAQTFAAFIMMVSPVHSFVKEVDADHAFQTRQGHEVVPCLAPSASL